MVARGRRVPNTLLRTMRRERGWSLARVAEELRLLAEAEDESHTPGVNADMVGVWERGYKTPGPYYRALLCKLYQRPASQLGFISAETTIAESPMISHQPMASMNSSSLPYFALANERIRALDLLCDPANSSAERQASMWLTLGASGIGQLFDLGWTLEAILASLQTVLQSVQAMPSITRRQLLQLSGAAVLGSVPILTGAHITEEERALLTDALGHSIESAWRQFHHTSVEQTLAVGQTLLVYLQRCYAELFPSTQSLFSSPIYRLIGAAYHFHGQYTQALRAHHQAYLTAVESGDVWNMAQSRIWQAYGLKEQRQYGAALQALESASRLVVAQKTVECTRTTAHIAASMAEIAALMNDMDGVQRELQNSEMLLEQIPGYHDEFDRASWYEIAGVCALHLKQYRVAASRLQKALEIQPPQSLLRRAATAIPLTITYAQLGEREMGLKIAEETIPLLSVMNAPAINQQFIEYTAFALSQAFPGDSLVETFVSDTRLLVLSQST